jgi:hypothetical protein
MNRTRMPSWLHHHVVHRVRDWYGKFERPVSLIFLLGGFAFNVFTLTRVDRFIENLWVGMHLLIVAVCIVFINRAENEETDPVASAADPSKLHFWLVNILQFFFGGLLSTFIVFYVRGSVIAVAWPFFMILLVAFIANESFKKHYARTDFQISFFFLSTYLFLIFFVPVLFHSIGPIIFLISGGFAIVILLIFIWILKKFTREGFKKGKDALYTSVISIYLVVNGFYFLHIIPPLPLSIQGSGIYHSVARQADGNYSVTTEDSTFIARLLEYVSEYPDYHTVAGMPAYAYSAVYSPGSFDTTIIHEWQKYDSGTKKWVTANKVVLPVIGGRDEGYRTYSVNTGLTEGRWRVNVTTPNGQLIGRMAFTVIFQSTTPSLTTEIKQ